MGTGARYMPSPLVGVPTHQGNSYSSLGMEEGDARVHAGEANTQRDARTEE